MKLVIVLIAALLAIIGVSYLANKYLVDA